MSELKRFQVFSKNTAFIKDLLIQKGLSPTLTENLFLSNTKDTSIKLEARVISYIDSTGIEIALMTESKSEWDWLEDFKKILKENFEELFLY